MSFDIPCGKFSRWKKIPLLMKKLKSASVEKPNVTYSNFINNLKKQMKTNEETGNIETKFKNKKKKNVFYDFLNQFVNKDKVETEPSKNEINNNIQNITNKNNVNMNVNNNIQINTNNNTNNNTNHNTNRNPNKVRKFRNIHKNRITNFCISASEIKKFNNSNNIGNNSELFSMKKELEAKEGKIKELMSIIEQWSNAYNTIVQENQKLKDEINNLKNGTSLYNQSNDSNINNKNDANKYNNINSINQNSNFDSNHSKKNEKAQYNNLITYNINKNNNYNIINSEINNFNNIIQSKNINNKEPVESNKREPLREREREGEQDRKARKERKASLAFERFKRMNRMNTAESSEAQKSDKISSMAKMLESHIGGPRRENSVDVCERIEDIKSSLNNGFNNDIVNIIDSQPVVNKKKKKMRSFSYDA